MQQAQSKSFPKIILVFLFLIFIPPLNAQNPTSNPERESAIKLLQEKQYAESVKAWRKFLSDSKNQKDDEGWLYLGIALYHNKEVNAARESLEKSLKLNAKSELAHSSYATILYFTGKFKDAEKEVNETLRLNPNNINALYLQAMTKYNKGEDEKALAETNLILRLADDFAPAYLLKVQLLIGQVTSNRTSSLPDLPTDEKVIFFEAAKYLEKYLQINPLAADALFWQERLNTLRFYSENKTICEAATATLRPDIKYRERIHYTEEARNQRITGTIRLRAIFDTDGQVKHIFPLNFLGGGMTNEAIKATRKIRFKPALKDGKPVCLSMILEYGFSELN